MEGAPGMRAVRVRAGNRGGIRIEGDALEIERADRQDLAPLKARIQEDTNGDGRLGPGERQPAQAESTR